MLRALGRIEDVHFNPWWSTEPKLLRWQMQNGEAFVFARSDWQYVLNTFCFGYHVGYKLGESVRRAVIMGNILTGPARIENKSRGRIVIGDNAADRDD